MTKHYACQLELLEGGGFEITNGGLIISANHPAMVEIMMLELLIVGVLCCFSLAYCPCAGLAGNFQSKVLFEKKGV
jgi:hypothetical protein